MLNSSGQNDFSPIFSHFSHFLPPSSVMQVSNQLHTHMVDRRPYLKGISVWPEAGHVLLFHSPKSRQHDQGRWGINVKPQLNTQPCMKIRRGQDVTETWRCLLRSCTVTGGSHSKLWC